MGKNFLFYTVAGTVFGVTAQIAGAGLTTILAVSFLAPPLILIAIRIAKYRAIR